ncbi:MAG TPA: trigger factor [Longimicrobiaceae bacterium]|nr:trigger factor [Longimicrobiaceae bacterium]
MASDTTKLSVSVEQTEPWARRISVTVPAERVQRTRGNITQQVARNARLPGFRKGKMPTSLIEKQFGASIVQETIDRTIQEAYREALEESGLQPINQGRVDRVEYDKGEPLTFEVELEVRPEVELARTSGFSVTRPPVSVGEEDVDSVLERLRDERAEWTPFSEGEKPDFNDQVMVEITAQDENGEPLEGEEPRSYRFVVGEGQAIPEVEEAIRTLAPGEEGDFTVHFPEDFPDEEQRGKAQHLHIKLDEGQHKVLPELNDELAQQVGEFETLAALRERILDDLKADAEQRAEDEVRAQLMQQIVEANPFDVPNSMVQMYLDQMIGHPHGDGEEHHHTPEQEEQLAKLREGLRPQAEAAIKQMLVVQSVSEKEGLNATQDEIDARVEELAEKNGRSAGEVWLQLEKSGQLEMLERDITEKKVFDYLLGQNTVA